MSLEDSVISIVTLQPYHRDPDIVRFQTSRRAGRRNAVTEDELLAIAAVVSEMSSQAADPSVADTAAEHANTAQTTETRAARLPADLSKLKVDGKDL